MTCAQDYAGANQGHPAFNSYGRQMLAICSRTGICDCARQGTAVAFAPSRCQAENLRTSRFNSLVTRDTKESHRDFFLFAANWPHQDRVGRQAGQQLVSMPPLRDCGANSS